MFAETLAPGKMTYDCVILRVQTPVVLRISKATSNRIKETFSIYSKNQRLLQMNPESWKHSECDSLSITDALVSHSTALSLFLLWVLHSPFFFQPGLFLLLFIPDYSPFQELSLTVLTMAPSAGSPMRAPLPVFQCLHHDRRCSPTAGQCMIC